ncbi:MAG: DUF2207 domain-containing protein [Propionibacterium sp.]|nr:DUF2207 domain-containing protein [Propionibacterium sp.]
MIRRALLAALVAAITVLGVALPAYANTSAPITRYDIDVTLRDDGVAEIVMEFTMDFGAVSGRGPILEFATKQYDGQDPDYWYNFDYSRPQVSSPSGARTNLSVDSSTDVVTWQIGHEDIVNRSAEDYRLEFTLDGIVAPDHPESGLDEFNWTIFRPNPDASNMTDVRVTISGPAAVEGAACFTGREYDVPCDAQVAGGELTAELAQLPNSDGLQVFAGFPAGTFVGAEQVRTRVPTLASNLTPGPVGYGVAGVLGAAAIVGSGLLVRRHKRDLVYLGLTPGVTPPKGEKTRVGLKDTSKIPVAVQFQPPKGATPGEIGTLIDATADGVDVSATLVDLAVRGYIQIEPGKNAKNFTLHGTGKDISRLQPFERNLLGSIFRGDRRRSMRQLRDEKYHDVMSTARKDLYRAMVDRHWFTKNPRNAGIGMFIGAAGLAVLGVMLMVALWNQSLALVGVPFLILAVGLGISATNASQRTPQGSAMLAQARGFELYLRTAEADQIKFEEGIDVFSRYLPYAMIFGVADRWAKIFSQLEAAGQYRTDTSWWLADMYVTPFYFSTMMSSFSSSFTGAMSTSASSYAASQASSGSSGGSGFSGGGGFGGGSVGSW